MSKLTKTMIFVVAVLVVLASIGSFVGRGSGWGVRRAYAAPDHDEKVTPHQDSFVGSTVSASFKTPAVLASLYYGFHLTFVAAGSTIEGTPTVTLESSTNGKATYQTYRAEVLNGNMAIMNVSLSNFVDPGSELTVTSTGFPTGTATLSFESIRAPGFAPLLGFFAATSVKSSKSNSSE